MNEAEAWEAAGEVVQKARRQAMVKFPESLGDAVETEATHLLLARILVELDLIRQAVGG